MKKHRTTFDTRENMRRDRIWMTIGKHCSWGRHASISGGHVGALYWALCAMIDHQGNACRGDQAELDFYKDRWRCEVTGGGERPYRPMHDTLWQWAMSIAQDEAMAIIADSIRSPKRTAA